MPSARPRTRWARNAIITGAALLALVAGLAGWGWTHPRTLTASIEIDATPQRVWEILTDFDAYPTWNPTIVSIQGEPEVGAHLEFQSRSSDGSTMTFRPTVRTVEPGRELRWLGRLLGPGVFDGEHYFLIEPLGPGRVRLTQGEAFHGVTVPYVLAWLGDSTHQGFEAMNAALKARAERTP